MGEAGGEAPSWADVVDMSAVGTLVWVRRPNGSWWPGRVVSPHDVPADCPPPTTRAPATPILLLGRRDGPAFVDWCNLERCKRVKPFRCGETDLEDCIRRAEEQAARRRSGRRDQRACATGAGSRYARKEDAVLQALDIERARLRLRSSSSSSRPTTTKPSHAASAPAVAGAGADAQPSSCTGRSRKRRTPNDSEDDAPQRMKDLIDIGAPPKHATPNAANLNRHLPSTSQMKRSKQSHHDSPKRKQQQQRPSADQDQPCGVSRKRDRSRPLSELCNGDMWKNGFTPNGQRAEQQHLVRATMSLDTVLGKPSSRRAIGLVKTESVGDQVLGKPSSRRAIGPVKTEPVGDQVLGKPSYRRAIGPVKTEPVGDQVLGKPSYRRAIGPVKTEPVDDAFPRVDDGPVYLAARSVLKEDNLHVHQPCAPTKVPTGQCTKLASNCGKDGISSQCDSRNSEKKTTSSADHEGSNRTKNASERDHRRERAAKHRAPSSDVILLEKRVEKSAAANKTAAPDDDKGLAVKANGLDRVGAVLQQHSEIKCKVEEPAETISNHMNRENVPVPSVVFELPHQVLPPQHRDPAATARCHAVKPVKTLQLNSSLYDVELSAQAASSSKGGRVPLVSLMSRSSRRPVVGYPVSVEVLDDSTPRPPAPRTADDHRPSTSNNTNRQPKKEEEEAAAAPRQAPPSSSHMAVRETRAKAKSHRKASEDDESWRPHTKNSPAPAASPRKMRRLSSFGPSQRGDRRPAVVGGFCRGPVLACIPLRLVFSRIHEALSYSGK